MTDEVRALHAQVTLGLEAEAFLGSSIGRALVARAEGEREAAIEALCRATPTDADAIRALQDRIWRAESVQFWLAELITESHNALEQLAEREHQ